MFNCKEYMDDLLAEGIDPEEASLRTRAEADRRKNNARQSNMEQAKLRETKQEYRHTSGPKIPTHVLYCQKSPKY